MEKDQRSSLDQERECGATKELDPDAIRLAEMGYTQELRRSFSVWAVLSVSFSLANSWFGISTALITGINSGGPVLLIYGIILVCTICLGIAVSLSELASAMPNAGGQYFWAFELAPPRYARFASYLTGWFAWAGSVFTCASIALGVGALGLGCIQLSHPDLVIQPWMVFVGYQVVNIFCFGWNLYSKILPFLSNVTFWISLTSFIVILITVPATAPTHQHADFVFATFINQTGWKSDGIAFIVGLINPNWALNGLDCATHMAEEIKRPEKMIPIAILGTVAIGFVTAWAFAISMMFSIGDFDAIAGTATGTPILELFYQALSNREGAIVLQSLIILTGCGCLIASHTWQARLCWSFARDQGLPFSGYLSHIHPSLKTPIRAHFVSCVIVSILGCLYLGSYTAFTSMTDACVVLLYISYSIPVICMLIRGRSRIAHGPFWLGPLGFLSNIVLLAWTLFTLIMYSFPALYPATPGNMNYVSAVYCVVVVILLGYWFIRGKTAFRHNEERHGIQMTTIH